MRTITTFLMALSCLTVTAVYAQEEPIADSTEFNDEGANGLRSFHNEGEEEEVTQNPKI